MEQNVKKVYSYFFLKHDEDVAAKQFIPEVTRLEIFDLSPSFFFGSIRKWLMNLLQTLLNLNSDDNQLKITVKLNVN